MPFMSLQTNVDLSEDKKNNLLKGLSEIITEKTGKPEKYCMISVVNSAINMSGNLIEPAVYCDIKAIGGFNATSCREMSEAVTAFLNEECGISSDRIYITFTDVMPSRWGWNGGLFG